jgi:hypothetical protein
MIFISNHQAIKNHAKEFENNQIKYCFLVCMNLEIRFKKISHRKRKNKSFKFL